ncbi:MAG: ACT domain-containing protein [Kiritimatiellae bacterium]|nr:ACT domain-containing protein [Kiritimatiellia bacterium]
MDKVVVTVVGKDRLGILAKTCTYLADNGINILDISQTIVRDYFNMMMIVDVSGSAKSFDEIGSDLARVGVELGLRIRCQKEEIFERMHRV